MQLAIHGAEHGARVFSGKKGCCSQRRLHIRDHERRGQTFAGGIPDGEGQTIVRKRDKIIAVAPQGPELSASCTVTDPLGDGHGKVHEPLLDIASRLPVLANVNYHCVAHFSNLCNYVGSEMAKSTWRPQEIS
jgi:hypothetical protein